MDEFPTEELIPTPSSSSSRPKQASTNLPWVEKYRPSKLSDLVSHSDILSTIERFIAENRLPHLLLYGPPGTGKTSTIKAVAMQLYGSAYKSMVLELNASDDRGLDVVREQIKNFASTKNVFKAGFKIIILDEADAMTNEAQAALRRVIEKYTKNTRFCLICNYVSKIIPAIQSRCTRFRFAPLSPDQTRIQIGRVVTAENLQVTPGGMDALCRLAFGDMRKALNILQSTAMAFPVVDEGSVYQCTGRPLPEDVLAILNSLLNDTYIDAFTNIAEMRTLKGLALQDILTDLHELVVRLEMPTKPRVFVLEKMAAIEERLSVGCSDKIQLGALVGAFQRLRTFPDVQS